MPDGLDALNPSEDVREQFRKTLQDRAVNRSARTKQVAPADLVRVKEFDRESYLASVQAETRAVKVLAEKKERDKIQQNLREWEARIEVRWRDAALERLSDSDVVSAIEDRVKRFQQQDGLNSTSLMISGAYGKGKTYVAYAYAHELIRQGFLKPSQVFIGTERVLTGIATSGFKKPEMMSRLLHPHYKFYLIDDVGRGSYSNPAQRGEIWYELLNHVYVNRLTLVLTTNLVTTSRDGGNTVAGWVGAAAVDRLRHLVGKAGNVVMSGDDKRTQLGQTWESDYQKRRN